MQITRNGRETMTGPGEWFTGAVFPGEDHWHGAAPARFMTHLAMLEVDDDGNTATWGAQVTDDEYGPATTATGQGE